MQYPPYNDPNNPYTQPTNQYPPYGQYPPQPGKIQKPLAHQRFGRWYGRQWKRSKFLTGCLTLIFVIFACGLCSGAMANASHNNAGITDVATATDTPAPTKLPVHNQIQTMLAQTPTPKPTSVPTPTPELAIQPTPTPVPQAPTCSGTSVDGVCYSFDPTGGSPEYNPVPDFCNVFSCISSFSTGKSYVVQCHDGMYSKSGGLTGSCSRHNGEGPTLYRH